MAVKKITGQINTMENTSKLPSDYYELFFDSESHFREKYGETAYFSKPVIHNVDGAIIAIAPWGNPGWSTPVIFPHTHYITVTKIVNDNLETLLFHSKDLLAFLASKYQVTESDLPIPHVIVQIPDFLADEAKEKEFWVELGKLPAVKN